MRFVPPRGEQSLSACWRTFTRMCESGASRDDVMILSVSLIGSPLQPPRDSNRNDLDTMPAASVRFVEPGSGRNMRPAAAFAQCGLLYKSRSVFGSVRCSPALRSPPIVSPARLPRRRLRTVCAAAMPKMPDIRAYQLERSEAVRAVAIANALARRVQRTFEAGSALSKADSSPVTVADFAVQALVVHRLHAAFPSDRFIAEESTDALHSDASLLAAVTAAVNAAALDAGIAALSEADVLAAIGGCGHAGGDGERTWVLDPIDGTLGFVNMRQYCISLALVHRGEARLGVLGCPNLSESGMPPPPGACTGVVFHAVRGAGAYMLTEKQVASEAAPAPLGQRVTASDLADPVDAIFCESVEKKHSSHALSAAIADRLAVRNPPVRMDSQAKYGCLARGDATVFLRFPRAGYVENIWDHAGGAVVLEEAGGRVTDGRGRPLDFSLGRILDNDDGIVATNGRVHDEVIEAIQKTLAEIKAKSA